MIVLIIVGVLLLCCVGGGIVTCVWGQSLIDQAGDIVNNTNNSSNSYYDDDSDDDSYGTETDPYEDTYSGGTQGTLSSHGNVLVDDDKIKITLGDAVPGSDAGWLEFDVTVENKTNKDVFIMFYEANINGKNVDGYVMIYTATDDEDFPPNKTTAGTLLFIDPPTDLDWKTFNGEIWIVDVADYDTIEEVPFDLRK
jgi:hypothetical protein